MMDKSFMIFIAIGIAAIYLVTNFVGDIQAEDEKYQNNDYNEERKYSKYKAVDSIGQEIIDVTDADAKTQVLVWNKCILKDEFLELFPDFSEMKNFIDDRVRGKMLQDTLKKKVNIIEDKFFSGEMDAEQAKRELSSLK